MPKKRHNFMLSDEAFAKLKRLSGIASMSAYLEKLIKDAGKQKRTITPTVEIADFEEIP
jgi:predicted CopG family antitoxin